LEFSSEAKDEAAQTKTPVKPKFGIGAAGSNEFTIVKLPASQPRRYLILGQQRILGNRAISEVEHAHERANPVYFVTLTEGVENLFRTSTAGEAVEDRSARFGHNR